MEYQSRILKVNQNDKFISERLGDIVKDCIAIDSANLLPGEGFKLQKPTN